MLCNLMAVSGPKTEALIENFLDTIKYDKVNLIVGNRLLYDQHIFRILY